MRRTFSRGFTIVELVVVITIAGILAGVLFGPLNDLYDDNNRSIKSVIQTADTRGALRLMEYNVTLSTAFLAQNVVPDPTGATWYYANASGVYDKLITSNYATDKDEQADPNGTRLLAYTDLLCSTGPLENNYVYFVSNGSLYRRTLKNTTTPGCGTVGQKQTCAKGYTNPSCEATDALLLSNVTSFTVQYFDAPESSTPITNPAAAHTVVLSVSTKTGGGAKSVTASSNIRISRVNGS